MSSADRTFHLIAWKKGLVPKPRLDQALAEARQQGVPLESLLLDRGDIDEATRNRILRTRSRHAQECPICEGMTYLLPGQQLGDVPCEHCGVAPPGSKAAAAAKKSGYYSSGAHVMARIDDLSEPDEEDATATQLGETPEGVDPAASTQLEPVPFGADADPEATQLEGPPPGVGDASTTQLESPPDANATLRMSPDAILALPEEAGGSGDLVLSHRMEPYRFDPEAGTIDGTPCPSFERGAFQFRNVQIEAGAGLVAQGRAPLILMAAGTVEINGSIDLCGQDGATVGAGGAGGRTVQITAAKGLNVDGTILAEGGRGGSATPSTGAGGGGAGGTILLQSFQHMTISGTVSALGGEGPGGQRAGEGRIHLEDAEGAIAITGVVTPSPQLGTVV